MYREDNPYRCEHRNRHEQVVNGIVLVSCADCGTFLCEIDEEQGTTTYELGR